MPIAPGKPDSRMSIEPSSFNAASTSQVRLWDAYLGGLMGKAAGRIKKKKIQKTPTVLRLKPGTKEEPVAQHSKAWETPCTRSQFFS